MCGNNEQIPDIINEDIGQYRQQFADELKAGPSPILEENIANQRAQMEEGLSRKLGSNWRSTTPGIQSISEFDRSANMQLQEDKRNRMNQAVGNYATLANVALTPYLADRQLQHDTAMTGMLSDAQRRSDLMGLVGNVGGMGLYSYLMGGKFSGSGTGSPTGGGAAGSSVGLPSAAGGGGQLLTNPVGITGLPSLSSGLSGFGSTASSAAASAFPAYGSTALPGSLTGGVAETFGASAIPGGSMGYTLPGASEQFASLYGMQPGAAGGASAGLSGTAALGGISAAMLAAPVLGKPMTSLMKGVSRSLGMGGKTAPAAGEYLQALTGGPQNEWTQNATNQWNTYLANNAKGITTTNPSQMIAGWIADSVFGATQYDDNAVRKNPQILDLAQRIANGEIRNDQLRNELDKIKKYSSSVFVDPTAH